MPPRKPPTQYRYLIVEVDGPIVERLPVGSIMVHDKHHDATGWASWLFHSLGEGNSQVTGVLLGVFDPDAPPMPPEGTPEYAQRQAEIADAIYEAAFREPFRAPAVHAVWENACTESRKVADDAAAVGSATV